MLKICHITSCALQHKTGLLFSRGHKRSGICLAQHRLLNKAVSYLLIIARINAMFRAGARLRSGARALRIRMAETALAELSADKESAIRADLRSGKAGIMKLAAMHGVGVGTVQRIKAALSG
jgi:hypothetical protein